MISPKLPKAALQCLQSAESFSQDFRF